ncbi:thioredoxin family protein [Ahniella affigens]|uniref:Thioredoxin family protein n=1 Tax=Ahniella affigens TaxID=2021234 RepID=A0A2P1PMK9_9GAMM|nr:thioredoxin family protein [Ahniella affigens]AVP96076.1 thioredoxin family protein [Ahniella affigens]
MNVSTFALLAAVSALGVSSAYAKPAIGQPAPDFTVVDANGQSHSLADFKGKTVVLEWNNPECPFVKKHYGAGNMQKQQADATAKGVVWLSVNSSAPGKQGNLDGAGANAQLAKSGAKPTAYLLDADGKVGHAYGARTTPHMFVIDGQGMLQYMGAIDSVPSADSEDIPGATQYVTQALSEMGAGKAVSVSVSEPYGCSVKYGS